VCFPFYVFYWLCLVEMVIIPCCVFRKKIMEYGMRDADPPPADKR